MKIRSIFAILIVLCCLLAVTALPVAGAGDVLPERMPAETNPVVQPLCDEALAARFLNMLNRNYAYDDDFLYYDTMIGNAVLALLDLREGDYISASYVSDYLFSMYGIELTDFSDYGAGFPQKEGYIYIIPRGFATFAHRILSVTENEDGSFTVETAVTVDPHDGESFERMATALFVPNDESAFGFMLHRCDLSVAGDSFAL